MTQMTPEQVALGLADGISFRDGDHLMATMFDLAQKFPEDKPRYFVDVMKSLVQELAERNGGAVRFELGIEPQPGNPTLVVGIQADWVS